MTKLSICQQEPVAWRCRSTDEPEWNYGEKPLPKKDLFRKEPGFEEQPLFTSPLTSLEKAPLPVGVPDTPETRARIQAALASSALASKDSR